MLSKRIKLLLLLTLILGVSLSAQEEEEEKPKNYELGGYITNMQSVQFEDVKEAWIDDNLIHNRLNFSWYPNDKLIFKLGVRNRVFTGESMQLIPNYGEFIEASELGYLDMNWNLIDEQSVILNSNIDRLYLEYNTAKLSVSVGRQRINWGKTFAWNPNDLFNAYSFFDFDYAERPGSDAVRLQYYTGMVSSIELAAKIDNEEKITAAALWRFNKWNYDFQLMGGILNENDYAVGGGWSGAIKNLDFKGEFTYLHPHDNYADTIGQFIGSVSTGYTFSNNMSVMFEFLYSDIPEGGTADFTEYYYQPLSIKTMAFTEYTLFGQYSFQITPLLTGSVSGMYYPKMEGYFVGPTIDYSFSDNLFASVVVQTFSGKLENPLTQVNEQFSVSYGFLRLKWSF